MSKYLVLKPVEYGPSHDKLVAYFPVGYWGLDGVTKKPLPCPYKSYPSGMHGSSIPVDNSGIIELPEEVAKELTFGQIAPLDASSIPDTSAYDAVRKGIDDVQARSGVEFKVEGPGGREEWTPEAKREVTPLSDKGTLIVSK